METAQILRGLLGDNGYYCVFAAKGKDNVRIQKFYDTIDEVVRAANKFHANSMDVYFALSTFKEPSNRKGENAVELKSFFLDLDCGPSKEYLTQKLAVDALRRFCKQLSLPRPLMINSGRGVHVYWPLSEAVSAKDWVDAAKRLKKACADNGLLADPAVTADVVRILRVPNTHNYKDDPALPVQAYGVDMPTPVDLSEFVSKLGVTMPVTTLDVGTDALYEAYAENSENVFRTIVEKTAQKRGCAQLGYIMTEQHEVSEPMWRAGLSIAKFCTDVDIAAVKISNKHPNYNEAEMRKKLDEIKGPYTCARFDELNGGVCQDCPLWGEIKSPIVLGKRIREAEGKVTITASAQGKKEIKEFDLPVYPNPYFRGAAGGVFLRTSDDDGDPVEECLYHNDLYVTRRLHDEELGETLVFRLHLPRDGVRQFTVPLTHVTSREEFRKSMAREGVTTWGKNLDKLMAYTTRWVDELQQTSTASEAHRQFGWVDDDLEAFVLGEKLVEGDKITYNPPSSKTASFMDNFEPKGSKERNLECLDFYNRDGFELHQYVVGVGFGSPLMALTGLNSMAVHLFGGTGVGKTTAQFAAMSIWGHPEYLSLQKSDTHNSRMNRGEVMHSLPLISDEMTNVTSMEMSDYVYQVSGGRQKNRLAANGNEERIRGKPWKLLALSSANTSAWEILSRDKATPKAEMQRLFEIKVPKMLFDPEDVAKTAILHEDFKLHYGHIGPEYIQWIINNREEALKTVRGVKARLDEAAKLGAENRFWSNGNAVVIAGLLIASKLGFVKYDVSKVYKWVVKQLVERNRFVNDIGASVDETVGNYLSENYNNILKIESTEDLRGKNDNGLDQLVPVSATPRGHLVARFEPDTKHLFLIIKPFKNWCVDQQINYASLVDDLKEQKGMKRVKKRLTKGTDFNMPAQDCLQLTFDGFDGVDGGSEGNEAR
jgi:hypothetical protein